MGKVVKGVYQSGKYGEAKPINQQKPEQQGSLTTATSPKYPQEYGKVTRVVSSSEIIPQTAPEPQTFSEQALYAERTSFPVEPVKEIKSDGRIKGFESPVEEKSYYAGKDKYYEEAQIKQYEREASASKSIMGTSTIKEDSLKKEKAIIPKEYLTTNARPPETGGLTSLGLGRGNIPPLFGGTLTETKREKIDFSSPFSAVRTGYDPFMFKVQKSLQSKEISAGRSGNTGLASITGFASAGISPISTKEKVKGLGTSAAIGLGIGAVTTILPPAGVSLLAVGGTAYAASQVPKLQESLLSSRERGPVAYRENVAYTGASIAAGVGGGYAGAKLGLKIKSLFPEKPQKPIKFYVTQEVSRRVIQDNKLSVTKANIEVIATKGKKQYLITGKGKSISFIGDEKSVDLGKVEYDIKPFKTRTEARIQITPESYGDFPTFKVAERTPRTFKEYGSTIKIQPQEYFGTTRYTEETFVSSSLLNNKPKDIGFDIVAGYKTLEGEGLPTRYKTIGYTESITGTKGTSPRIVSTKPTNIRSGFSSVIAETEAGGVRNQLVSYSDIHTTPKNILPDFKMVKSSIKGKSSGMSSITGNAVSELKLQNMPDTQSATITRTIQTSAKSELKSISIQKPISKVIPLTLIVTKQIPVTKTQVKTKTFITQKPTTITGVKSDILPIQKPLPISKVSPIEKTVQINEVLPIQKQIPLQKQVPVQKQITKQKNLFNIVPPVPIGFTPPQPPQSIGYGFGALSGYSRYGKSYISSKYIPRYTPSLEASVFGIKRTRMPKTFTGIELRGL